VSRAAYLRPRKAQHTSTDCFLASVQYFALVFCFVGSITRRLFGDNHLAPDPFQIGFAVNSLQCSTADSTTADTRQSAAPKPVLYRTANSQFATACERSNPSTFGVANLKTTSGIDWRLFWSHSSGWGAQQIPKLLLQVARNFVRFGLLIRRQDGGMGETTGGVGKRMYNT
jgi:hypothetical protein